MRKATPPYAHFLDEIFPDIKAASRTIERAGLCSRYKLRGKLSFALQATLRASVEQHDALNTSLAGVPHGSSPIRKAGEPNQRQWR